MGASELVEFFFASEDDAIAARQDIAKVLDRAKDIIITHR